jgi:ankyrin repeat protein
LEKNNFALAHFLIEKGANCRRKNKEGLSALEYAEIHRYGDIVEAMNKKLQNFNLT